MALPRFSDLQGIYYTLPALPPCHFTGMNTQFFPLRANLDTLQQFCNRYVNIMPHELGWFRVVMPYAYFAVIDYGKMAAMGGNTGWLSQHEVMFTIPVEWYCLQDGEWVFQDWCWLTPFIFVDSETSMTLGRTVWGWPKSLIQVVPNQAVALGSPTGNSPLLRMASAVFPKAYAGAKQEMRIFLEINRAPTPSFVRVPPSADNPFLPWNIASQMFGSGIGFLNDCMMTATGMARSPLGTMLYPSNIGNMMGKAAEMIEPGGQKLFFNTLCLKQFRHSGSPKQYCYQALTLAKMQVTSFNQGGMLGDSHVMLGDQSGGYSIDLWNWPSLPIVDTLGLEVEERWQDGEVERVRLRPVLPIWYDVNMIYNLGHSIAWRSFDRTWHDPRGRSYPPLGGYSDPNEAMYNTSTGASGQALTGPFYFPSATLRVMPLLAHRATLATFIDRYLNVPLHSAGQRFRIWASEHAEVAYVYMAAIHYGKMASESNDIGAWANYNLSFLVPVIHEELKDGTWELVDVGLVPAYTYVDSTTAAITNSEVFGIPASRGRFVCPASVWMTHDGLPPEPEQPLLRVSVELLPAMDEGQQIVERVVAEICQTIGVRETTQSLDGNREAFCQTVTAELLRKYATKVSFSEQLKTARALALSVLAGGASLKHYTLKQFRDVNQPDLACYQSLTCIDRTFNEVFLIKEMELPIQVRIHEYPTQPLVKLLGLIYRERQAGDGEMVYTLEPLRPFWIHASLTDSLGTRILFRAGNSEWRDSVLEMHSGGIGELRAAKRQRSSSQPLPLSTSMDALLSDIPPLRLKSLIESLRGDPLHAQKISPEERRRAIESIDPQMVIESILSREWEDRTSQARWWVERERMERTLKEQLQAEPPSRRAAIRRRFVLKELKHTQSGPHHPDVHAAVLAMLDKIDELTELAKKVETVCENFTRLSASGRVPTQKMLKQHDSFVQKQCAALRGFLSRHQNVHMEALGERLRLLEAPPEERRREQQPSAAEQRANVVLILMRQKEIAQQIFEMLVSEEGRLRVAVLDKLAKAWQKPDFCVRRDIAGGDRDRLFPRELSWADKWFVGWKYS